MSLTVNPVILKLFAIKLQYKLVYALLSFTGEGIIKRKVYVLKI